MSRRDSSPSARLPAPVTAERPETGRYFGQRPVGPSELPSLMRKHIITGCMGAVYNTVIGSLLFIFFGNSIGMTQLLWGVLGGISSWAIVVQPLGAILSGRLGSRKKVWFWFVLSERILRALGIITAFFLWRAGYPIASLALMTAVIVATVSTNLGTAPWWGWLAAIIPQDVQGTFWGRRDTWTSLAVIVATVPTALVVDVMPAGGKMEAVTVILLAVTLVGLADILVHGTIPEPAVVDRNTVGSLSHIMAPLRNRRFRPWLLFNACWTFSMMLGGSLAILYFMENLEIKNNLLGGTVALTVTSLLGTILVARRAGRLVDRLGIRRMLYFGHFFWSFLPSIWLFATPRTAVFWISLASLVGGTFPVFANNAALKLVTRFPQPDESAMYVAMSSTLANMAGGLGAFAAGTFLHLLDDWSFALGGVIVSAFTLLFIASTVFRLASAVLLIPRVRERAAVPEDQRPLLLPLFFGLPGIRRRPGKPEG